MNTTFKWISEICRKTAKIFVPVDLSFVVQVGIYFEYMQINVCHAEQKTDSNCWMVMPNLVKLGELRQVNVFEATWKSELGKKGELSNSERGMVVGARRVGLRTPETEGLLGFSHTTIFRRTESARSVCENTLLMSEENVQTALSC